VAPVSGVAGLAAVHWDWSGLTLEASGDAARVHHLVREFGAGIAGSAGGADLEIRFESTAGQVDHHKATWWRLAMSAADQSTIRLSLQLHGLFADAMVQSTVIEQALAILAPRHQLSLIPAAAVRSPEGRTIVVLGSAGAGKTTLAMSALVGGWLVLGDDHLLVDRSGRCFGLPRRMRVYPSTVDLLPPAARRLLPSERRALRLRRVTRQLTVGRVGLPVLVPPERFGHTSPAVWTVPDWIVSIRRSVGTASGRWTAASPTEAARSALDAITTDRDRLARVLGEQWNPRLEAVHAAEASILTAGWRGISAARAEVPGSWTPSRTLEWLARETA
jgi:hypothetical protein